MKKIILFLSVAALVLSFSSSVKAQPVRRTQHDFKNVSSMYSTTVKERNSLSLTPYKVSMKAIRHFIRSYNNISDEKWYKLSDGFVVHFYKNDTKHRAFYKKNGNWVHTVSNYGEDKLPLSTRQRVKSVYYDYNILLITEIELAKKTIYLVKIENRTSLKTIRVCEEEEMEEIEYHFKMP